MKTTDTDLVFLMKDGKCRFAVIPILEKNKALYESAIKLWRAGYNLEGHESEPAFVQRELITRVFNLKYMVK